MCYLVYIVKCSDNTFYTGIARDLEKRLREHNGEIKGGAIYTRSRRPIVLKYSEKFSNRSDALKREYEIKQMERSEKEKLLSP
jgi:putative endonuclease